MIKNESSKFNLKKNAYNEMYRIRMKVQIKFRA